jgi:hypothetical protein
LIDGKQTELVAQKRTHNKNRVQCSAVQCSAVLCVAIITACSERLCEGIELLQRFQIASADLLDGSVRLDGLLELPVHITPAPPPPPAADAEP